MALPFEDFFVALAGPNARHTSTLEHVHYLIDRHSKSWQSPARSNLGDIGAGDSFLSRQLQKGGRALALSPVTEFHGSQILNMVSTMDRQSEALDPLLIRIRFIPKVCRRPCHLSSFDGPIRNSSFLCLS